MHYSFPLYPILVPGSVLEELNEMNGYVRGDNCVRACTQRIDDAMRDKDTHDITRHVTHTDARHALNLDPH